MRTGTRVLELRTISSNPYFVAMIVVEVFKFGMFSGSESDTVWRVESNAKHEGESLLGQ